MRLEESWAVEECRIRSFFRQQPDAVETEAGFLLDGCTVTLKPEIGNLGPWKIRRTTICLEGPEELLRKVYRQFFLRFLSAGG